MEFITRLMNDQTIRQRFKASEERRAHCEKLWAEQGIEDVAEGGSIAEPPAPEPDEPEVIVETEGTIEEEEPSGDTAPDDAEDHAD